MVEKMAESLGAQKVVTKAATMVVKKAACSVDWRV